METIEQLTWQESPFGEHYLKEVNKSAFQRQLSKQLFAKHFAKAFDNDETLYVIVGTDSGLLLKYVQQYYDELKNSRFVFIDFDNVLTEIKEQFDAKKYERINVFKESFDLALLGQLYSSYLVTGKIELFRSIAVLDAKRDEPYAQLWHHYQESFQQFLVVEKNALDSRPFIDAMLLNASHNLEPLINHSDALQGGTALILGGGPSLDEALPWIKQVREKLVIFSAGRIARRLLAEGISPDFFVSVDPYDISFDNSKGMFHFVEDSILLNGNHISPKILAQWSGASSYMSTKYPWHEKDGKMEKNIAAPGPNVINTAVNAAVELGCSQIIFSGVDLCFPLGKAYESSSDEAKVGGRFTFKGVSTVKDNRGELAETQPAYANARQGLELQVKIYLQEYPHLNFINTGLYSAAMENVEYVAPEKIEQKIDLVSKKQQVASLKQSLEMSLSERTQRVESSVKELQSQLKRFKSIVSLSKDGLKFVKTLYKNGQQDDKSVKKSMKAHSKISQIIGDDGDMLFRYDSVAFKENFRPMDEQNMEQEDIESQLTSFFKGVNRSAEMFSKQLELAIHYAKLTEDELKNRDFDALSERWQKYDAIGRVFNFVKWHPEALQVHAEKIEALQQNFYDELSNTQTRLVESLEKKSRDLPSLISRIEQAKEQHNRQTLVELLEHLQSLQEDAAVKSLIFYVQGLLADIDGNAEEAIAVLKQAEDNIIKEKALLKCLSICMQARNHQCSLQTLEALCSVSLNYMIPYADFLKTIGQLPSAIQILEIYVQAQSQDFDAWAKLIQFTHEVDPQRAKQIAEQVIEYDPENEMIKAYL
ncbi:6-hydroxymethylpterin diphosphokinase MptE-like protein [Thiomicrorhabdus sediminis]|uniref:DUF115 domain-containing protein n=1 Tax=Thiomicrorhabdus sediminis TaxID=2580412 RepID=A0A4P9K877_9GAMM|nr:6-hydroxymethylpterin diphosphokinase MptE-like protein [Thiomicrorhabdus sediminis]QCU90467.1 DUF115 domain-containing protein [Thiomicrorhabdus sediminis]